MTRAATTNHILYINSFKRKVMWTLHVVIANLLNEHWASLVLFTRSPSSYMHWYLNALQESDTDRPLSE